MQHFCRALTKPSIVQPIDPTKREVICQAEDEQWPEFGQIRSCSQRGKIGNRWECGQPAYDAEFLDAFDWLSEKAEWWLEHEHKNQPVSLETWADALWLDEGVQAAWTVAVETSQRLEQWKQEQAGKPKTKIPARRQPGRLREKVQGGGERSDRARRHSLRRALGGTGKEDEDPRRREIAARQTERPTRTLPPYGRYPVPRRKSVVTGLRNSPTGCLARQ